MPGFLWVNPWLAPAQLESLPSQIAATCQKIGRKYGSLLAKSFVLPLDPNLQREILPEIELSLVASSVRQPVLRYSHSRQFRLHGRSIGSLKKIKGDAL